MANEKRLDLIDRNALKAALEKYQNELWDYEDLLAFLDNEVTSVDAVEVVRCKDCKKAHNTLSILTGKKGISCTARYGLPTVKPDDFCSYGERREGE